MDTSRGGIRAEVEIEKKVLRNRILIIAPFEQLSELHERLTALHILIKQFHSLAIELRMYE